MTVEEIIALCHAGYNSDQIMQLAQAQQMERAQQMQQPAQPQTADDIIANIIAPKPRKETK